MNVVSFANEFSTSLHKIISGNKKGKLTQALLYEGKYGLYKYLSKSPHNERQETDQF